MASKEPSIFDKLKDSILSVDPVYWVEKYLTLDGQPFRLSNNGYKPFADIYRYVGIKGLERNSKPVVLVKGRQVGGTTMAAAIEMYFMGCGQFGIGEKSPMRIMHVFPWADMAASYTKSKLNQLIQSSVDNGIDNKTGKQVSYLESLLDNNNTSDSLRFKQFKNGNHIWIDSTGLNGDRLRGRTIDAIFFDECFPYNQFIETENGKVKIGKLYNDFANGKPLPLVKSFNEEKNLFEYKKINNAWCRGKKQLIEITCGNRKIKCTPNHRFLTSCGWKQASDLTVGERIPAYIGHDYRYETVIVNNIKYKNIVKTVYDIGVDDNHNFILSSRNKSSCGLIAHNCQDITGAAMSNSSKMLSTAKYGKIGDGLQVYFGTPKRKGSDFHKMWNSTSQQYYHLGCEKCKKHFPLYTPESDDWEKVWLHGYIVKCVHCGHEQDKRKAAEYGKWVATKDPENCVAVGFHINQLYMPEFTKEKIMSEKPGIHPINTEKAYRNEVLGEFYQGDSSPITIEEVIATCGEYDRKMRKGIIAGEEPLVVLGIDYGARADLEQTANPDASNRGGQSYSTAVVLSVNGPKLFSVEYATKFKRNDPEYKKGLITQIVKNYSVDLAIGDIGFSNDFSVTLYHELGDKYLVSRAHNKVNNKTKFSDDIVPKEIVFERDHYLGELFELLKNGHIKFPLGSYDQVGWLLNHICSMEVKPQLSKYGDPVIHYVKGGTPNDGLMALLNAYIAYKFKITNGFTTSNTMIMNQTMKDMNKPLILLGKVNKKF